MDTVLPGRTSVWKSRPQPLRDLIIQQDNPTQPFQLCLILPEIHSLRGPSRSVQRKVSGSAASCRTPRRECAGTAKNGAERASDLNHSLEPLAPNGRLLPRTPAIPPWPQTMSALPVTDGCRRHFAAAD